MQSIDRFDTSSTEESDLDSCSTTSNYFYMAYQGQTRMFSSESSFKSPSTSNDNPTINQTQSQAPHTDEQPPPSPPSIQVAQPTNGQHIKVVPPKSDPLPTNQILEEVADIPVYDAHRNSRSFRSLYSGREHQGQRQLIVFIRHFYCGSCKAFIRALVDALDPHAYFSLPVPTTVTVIGCGGPNHIPRYAADTSCPFKIYTDPTRKLYKALGMSWSIRYGPRPKYNGDMTGLDLTIAFPLKLIRGGYKNARTAGNFLQVGGEFMFEAGVPVWCHRMRYVRGHAEMPLICRVLEMDDSAATNASNADEIAGVPGSGQRSRRGSGDLSKTCGVPAKGLKTIKEGGKGVVQASLGSRDRKS